MILICVVKPERRLSEWQARQRELEVPAEQDLGVVHDVLVSVRIAGEREPEEIVGDLDGHDEGDMQPRVSGETEAAGHELGEPRGEERVVVPLRIKQVASTTSPNRTV